MATGEEIRHLREALGLSQAALARAIGVKPPTIGKIERGQSRRSRHKQDVESYLGLSDAAAERPNSVAEPTLQALFTRLQVVEAKLDSILAILASGD